MSPLQLLTGFLLGTAVSVTAWKTNALTRDGAIAAATMGTLIFGLGGLPWAVLLLTFFVTSSGLSRLFSRRKTSLDQKFSKGSRRDWAQVAANGGLGVLLILAQTVYPDQIWPWWAYAGALASVNADTWATELGTFSKALPRMITTGKKVEKGTSGGITFAGTLSALAGAALMGAVAGIFPVYAEGSTETRLFIGTVTLAGLFGSLIDSLLGATLQAIYHCPTCHQETERHPLHTCGTPTEHTQGLPWLNNDGVNFAASVAGAVISASIGFNV